MSLAISGLQQSRVRSGEAPAVFGQFRAERDAYEAWLTDDDQSNMYAALAAAKAPGRTALLDTTWRQAVSGHRTALAGLRFLSHLPSPVNGPPPRRP